MMTNTLLTHPITEQFQEYYSHLSVHSVVSANLTLISTQEYKKYSSLIKGLHCKAPVIRL